MPAAPSTSNATYTAIGVSSDVFAPLELMNLALLADVVLAAVPVICVVAPGVVVAGVTVVLPAAPPVVPDAPGVAFEDGVSPPWVSEALSIITT